MSGDSPWNDSGYASPPNSNCMDERLMPSATAQAARDRTLEIMDSLKNGKPGDADALMGDREADGHRGITPLGWLKGKMKGGKKTGEGKEGKGDGVVR